MSDFRVTVEEGDLEKAHRALAGIGGRLGPALDGGYTHSDTERTGVNRLVVFLDADDEDDARGLVMAVLSGESRIVSVEEV